MPEPSSLRCLALVTKFYPYGNGETFLTAELEQLSAEFDEIVIFSRHDNLNGNDVHRPVPSKVSIINVSENPNTLRKAMLALASLTRRRFWSEAIGILMKGLALKPLIWKTCLEYDVQAENLSSEIQKHLNRLQRNPSEFVWYSYWCDNAALMLSAWKSKNLIRGAFARTHGFDVYEERHPHSYLPFRNSIFSSLDRIFCISEHGTDYLKHRYEYQERFRTFRLGVEDREPVSTQLNSGFVRLMSVSSIVPVKNLELLIKAIAAIDDIRIDWRHIGSGNRDYEDSVLRLAEDYLGSKSNVTYSFMGHLSHEDVMQTIQAIRPHALMNTSSFEGIPVSMMEAASMGIPLIGPNICGVPEIIRNGINGFLFELGSVTEASDRIRTLANLTPEAYQEMCANSLSIQRTDFSAETNFRTLSETILNCC